MVDSTRLSAEHRAVVELMLVRGRTHDDIAQKLGMERADVERIARDAASALGMGERAGGRQDEGDGGRADAADDDPILTRVDDIDVPQDLAHEKRAYRVRLVFAVVFGLLIVAGLLGLLGGSGALSETSASTSGVSVEYERFLRFKTPTDITVKVDGGAHKTNIALSHDFLENFRVQGYSVEPESTAVTSDRVVYTFDQQPPSQITLVVEPQQIGRQSGTVYGPGRSAVDVDQWVWP